MSLLQTGFHGGEVHWLLDDAVIVRRVVWIHWFQEGPGHLVRLQGSEYSLESLVVFVSEGGENCHGVLSGLALGAHVHVDVVGLTLKNAHTAPMVPVLTTVAANVEL